MCGGGGGNRGGGGGGGGSPAPAPTPAPTPVAKAVDPRSIVDDPNTVTDTVDTNRRKKRAGNASNAGISRLKISSGANVGGAGGSGVNVATPV
jgi:hypothetical protein